MLSSTHYYSLAGHLLGELQVSGSSSATNFFLTDGLGSVLGVFSDTANTAALLSTQLFIPYGTQLVANGNSIGQYTTKGFTGQYSDAVSGLDYYVSRFYDPVAGVFLSADKAKDNTQGLNPYDYVGNNPETENDPTGQYFAPPGNGNGGTPSCTDNNTCNSGNSSGYGGSGNSYNPSLPVNPCSINHCSVTIKGHTFSLNELQNYISSRIEFLQVFYAAFAPGYGNAEIAFFGYLISSGRLAGSAYWRTVDYMVMRDQLLAAYDFLHHVVAQYSLISYWLSFLNHPTSSGWWEAHNRSINSGDQLACASGLYAKESVVEQDFINETIHVLGDVQSASQIPLIGSLFSPQASTTSTLTSIFYPQHYDDVSTAASLFVQGTAAGTAGGVVGGVIGALAGSAPGAIIGGLIGITAGSVGFFTLETSPW